MAAPYLWYDFGYLAESSLPYSGLLFY